ncbi:hypothetical protein ACOME3_001704 [Neoechinorhynchus agilis]
MFCGIIQKIVDMCMVNYGYDCPKQQEEEDERRFDANGRSKSTKENWTQTDDWDEEYVDTRSYCFSSESLVARNCAKNGLKYELYQVDKPTTINNRWFNPVQAYVLFLMDTNQPSISAMINSSDKMTSRSSFTEASTPFVPLAMIPNAGSDFSMESSLADSFEANDWGFALSRTNIADEYEKHFFQKDHSNLVSMDELLGPVVLSLKNEDDGIKKYLMRCILRLSSGSRFTVIDYSSIAHKEPQHIYKRIVRQLDPRLYRNNLQPVSLMNCLDASRQIMEFDKKMEINAFKFGILYQRSGQTTEEAILSNRGHSEVFERFLDNIAERVRLQNFDKYLGGLDKCGDIEIESYYTKFKGKEIMFHVSTMIPYRSGDRQQLERKRHIGNDIVIIVFQDCADTSFTPEMFQSKFSHCMIVVRPKETSDGTSYEINVLKRKDVPDFPPPIPSRLIPSGPYLKTFLLTKLIQAEYACYRAKQFRGLQTTARRCLLESLVLKIRPDVFRHSPDSNTSSLSVGSLSSSPSLSSGRNSVIYTVKKALLSKKMRQKLADQNQAARAKSLPSESEPRLPELRGEFTEEDDFAEIRRMRNLSDSNPYTKMLLRPYSTYMAWLSQDSLDKANEQTPMIESVEEREEDASDKSTESSSTTTTAMSPLVNQSMVKEDIMSSRQSSIDRENDLHINTIDRKLAQMKRRFKSLNSIGVNQVQSLIKHKNHSLTNLPAITSSEF